MITSTIDRVITSPEAAELAGITYRQLDHWARRDWVTPSVSPATGRSSRRGYSVDDVLRLRMLRHFGQAGWAVSDLGPKVTAIDISQAFVVMAADTGLVTAADMDELIEHVTAARQVTAYALGAERERLLGDDPRPTDLPQRRSA